MSKRHRHAKPCPTPLKTPFGSQIAADLAIARIRAEDNPARVKLPCRSYRCPCGRWHMTSRAEAYDTVAERMDAASDVARAMGHVVSRGARITEAEA